MVCSLPPCRATSCVDDMYGDVGVEEVKCRCVTLCVCALSQEGADRQAGKQAGSALYLTCCCRRCNACEASTTKHCLYVILELVHFDFLHHRYSAFPHTQAHCFVPLSSPRCPQVNTQEPSTREGRKKGKGLRVTAAQVGQRGGE